jgi:preprotein translocase subunit Sec61beta
MAQEQIRMPTSGAGITRYSEETGSKLTLRPGHVVIACAAVFVVILILHAYGGRLLGI